MKALRLSRHLAFAALATGIVQAKEPVFVAIDDASVATIGAMPLDRGVYARAIEAATAAGAKALVLKFFFDEPRNPESDEKLATAIAHGAVFMQVEATDGAGRAPTAAFIREGWTFAGVDLPFEIGNVDPPLPDFERGARAVGFVTARPGFDQAVEVAGRWNGRPVPSLQLEAVELALNGAAQIRDGAITLDERRVKLDLLGRVACDVQAAPSLMRYGIDQLLAGAIPRAALEGRVVILGYDRRDSPTLKLGKSEVRVHEAFNRQVSCLYRALAK